MIRPWHVLVFALALVAFFVLRAPASLVVRESGPFAFDRVTGPVWRATFEGAHIGPFDAGFLQTRLLASDLLRGQLHVRATANGPQLSGDAAYQAGLSGDKRLLAPRLVLKGLPLRPDFVLAGETTLRDLDIRFADGRCVSATGQAASDVLTRNGQFIRWEGPELVGGARCVGADAEIAVSGQDQNGRFALLTFLSPDGSGRWRLETVSGKAETTVALALLGFRPDPSGGMTLSGDFRWLPS
jgi:general secretion pathway protein N